MTQKARPTVKSAKLIVLAGTISDSEFEAVKSYVINPVEMRLASLEKPETLALDVTAPEDVAVVKGFISMDERRACANDRRDGLCNGQRRPTILPRVF